MMRRTIGWGCAWAMLFCWWGVASTCLAGDDGSQELRRATLRGGLGTYDAAPRDSNGHVDITQLLAQLADLRANTYNWRIGDKADDWGDLAKFLPLARQRGINVWVCLMAPSETTKNGQSGSKPFGLDYERWATEIAKLSAQESNLMAWVIDDFGAHTRILTPDRMTRIVASARKIHPQLAFVPCLSYAKGAIDPQCEENYRKIVDGILFPYRPESVQANQSDVDRVCAEVKKMRAVWGTAVPILLAVDTGVNSPRGPLSPKYLRQLMTASRQCVDGIQVYDHPNPKTQAESYRLLKDLFHDWSTEEDVLF